MTDSDRQRLTYPRGHLPQCSEYTDRTRCPNRAPFWLRNDAGNLNPGGYVCREHGEAITSEYTAKLGETWTLEPIIETRDAWRDDATVSA